MAVSGLSWSSLASSWRSLGRPSASLGSLSALEEAPGGLRDSCFVDLGVDFRRLVVIIGKLLCLFLVAAGALDNTCSGEPLTSI